VKSEGPGPWMGLLLAGVLSGGAARALSAQDSAAVIRDTTAAPQARAAADTVYPRSPVSPMGAFWRSLLVPGWGQAKLHRKLTGAIFVTWEGVTLGMSIKTSHELAFLREVSSGQAKAKQQERQDWLVLLAFNHLFSALEGYVSAHLWDFPEDLEINAGPVPGSGFGASVRVPFRMP
jgi:hypothetical protein